MTSRVALDGPRQPELRAPERPISPGRQLLFRAGYFGLHLSCLGVFFVGNVTVSDGLTFLGSYSIRMFCLVAVLHRHFAHNAYVMHRGFRFICAAVGCLAAQKGPLWWSYNHEPHHRFADGPGDPHSPWIQGYWLAQLDWLAHPTTWRLDPSRVPRRFRDCAELIWLERVQPILIGGFVVALGCWSGWRGILWGFCLPTVLIWHGIHGIGIFGHRFGGYRRYQTNDQSRNKWLLALLTLGEGWHNNHHQFPWSARLGFFWYEYDPAFWGLKVLSWLRLVHGLRVPSSSMTRLSSARPAASAPQRLSNGRGTT